MSNGEENFRRVIQGETEQGLTLSQRAQVKVVSARIVQNVVLDVSDPRVAFVALLNVLASLIASQFPATEHQDRIDRVVTYIPLYVQAYVQKELK